MTGLTRVPPHRRRKPAPATGLGRTRQAGFTLLELMVVVGLSALVLGLAAPALDGLLARQRLRTASYDLVTDLTLARSESLKRAADVLLQPTTGGDWRSGWRLTTGAGELLAQRNPSSLRVTAPGGSSVRHRPLSSAHRLLRAVPGCPRVCSSVCRAQAAQLCWRDSVATPTFFNHFGSLVALFAGVDDDFFTPLFACAT
jgi:prepilin-type N-terminal cleavage/methylation domain-containing protein